MGENYSKLFNWICTRSYPTFVILSFNILTMIYPQNGGNEFVTLKQNKKAIM